MNIREIRALGQSVWVATRREQASGKDLGEVAVSQLSHTRFLPPLHFGQTQHASGRDRAVTGLLSHRTDEPESSAMEQMGPGSGSGHLEGEGGDPKTVRRMGDASVKCYLKS